MNTISRRDLLIGTAAVAAAASMPAIPAPAIPAPEIIPAWVVGTPGEFNWQHIVARTAEEAERIFRAEWCDDSCEGDEDAPCGECDFCTLDVDSERKPMWDGKSDVTPGDWLRSGTGHICSRCSYETFPQEGGHGVGDEAVCEDCMTLDDWDIVDPEYAAELRAEPAPQFRT